MTEAEHPTEVSEPSPVLAARLREIGPYSLREVIGEGGMGAVYRAEQTEPVWREVAIKVTRVDLAGAGHLTRFEAERQILATLNHPNIAQVYEAGNTPEGFPYMVMEYIDGSTLRRHCDERRLGLEARIGLFIEVCAAVQHAHQRGVIHRDIKPSNILVVERSRRAVTKLIDFGIAKLAAAAPGSETRAGTVLGTPVYMSPEQIDAAADVDTRTDVYSLGVVLYQLLSGSLPRGRNSRDTRQWLEDVHTLAPRPSRRLAQAEDRERLAGLRGTSSKALVRELGIDLDWIVLRAMAPEREQRYDTPAALADDLQRYLDGLPVQARPFSRGYVVGKFLSRHRWESTLAALLLLALLGSGIFLTRAWRDERHAHAEAEQSASEAQAINQFLLDMLAAPDPRVQGREVRVIDVLDQAAEKAATAFPDQPRVRAALLQTLGRSYAGLAENQRAVDLTRQALAIRQASDGPDSAAALQMENDLLEAEVPVVPLSELRVRMKDLYARSTAALGPRHPTTLTAMNNFGTVSVYLVGNDQSEASQHIRNDALDLLQRNLKLREEVYGVDDPLTTHARNNLAGTLAASGRKAEAVVLYRDNIARQLRLFGEDNHYTLTSMDNLSNALFDEGEFDEAFAWSKRAIAGLRKVNGIDHPTTLQTMLNYADGLFDAGRVAEGEQVVREAVALDRARADGPSQLRHARNVLESHGIVLKDLDLSEPSPAAVASEPDSATESQNERDQQQENGEDPR